MGRRALSPSNVENVVSVGTKKKGIFDLTVWVEEILEVWFPLSQQVANYSCPALDSMATTFVYTHGGNPSADRTWVIDVGIAFDELPENIREVLLCIYGMRLSLRSSSRKVRKSKTHVQRWRDDGLKMMGRELEKRGVKLSVQQAMRY